MNRDDVHCRIHGHDYQDVLTWHGKKYGYWHEAHTCANCGIQRERRRWGGAVILSVRYRYPALAFEQLTNRKTV
jgi:hypothetical protein